MSSRNPDIAVVGGGIVGLACARELARRGASVVVLERDAVGRSSTSAAAGMLAPLSEVRVPGPLFEACRAARDRWAAFHSDVEDATGAEVEYDRSGALITGVGEAELAVVEEIERAAAELGERCTTVDPRDVRERVPDLDHAIARALHLPGEHRVDNVRFVGALADAARRDGVRIQEGTEVTGVTAGSSHATLTAAGGTLRVSAVVLAAGAWAAGLGAPPLPVRPVRGQMIRLTGAGWPWTGTIRVGGHYYGIRRGERDLLFGATLEEAGFDDRTTPDGVRELLRACRRAFPGLAEARLVGFWSGLRPGTADGLPVVGRLAGGPLWVAGGHFRNGILLAPWTAATLAPWVLGERAEPEDNPFSPGRFESP